MIPPDFNKDEENQWHYYPPKWYHFKFRGGRFVLHNRGNPKGSAAEVMKRGLEFGEELRKQGKGDWHIENITKYYRYQVAIIGCFSKEDAAVFKLACL